MRIFTVLLLFLLGSGQALADPSSDIALLQKCYPDAIRSVEPGNTLVLSDGSRLPYDDGLVKDSEQTLELPDLEDMLAQPYPLAAVSVEPAPGFHPGRRRVTALFKAEYGHDQSEVTANLVPVRFLNTTVQFNTRNGAAAALEAVGRDLSALVAAHPEYSKRILPIAGTFAWRPIARTERLSAHSFGVAIDLNAKINGYWQWNKGEDPLSLRVAFPAEIAKVFERHGFIWGGKWAEYDIMHFEYRPEIIQKALAAK